MEKLNQTEVETRTAFKAVGLKWEGTFAEAAAGGIRLVQQELHRRITEIDHAANAGKLLGLSYHAHPGESGFTHYAVLEVTDVKQVPSGMVQVSIPTLRYARYEHHKGQEIDKSYQNIYAWIEQQAFSLYEGDLTHVEEYPISQDPHTKEPEFTIMIPIS